MSIEELRTDLATEAKELPDAIQTARESFRNLSGDLAGVLDTALNKANSLSTRAQEALGAELLPVRFTGLIHNYRFGMADGKPMHRFDVEVPGTGLWLACQFTSTELDALLLTAFPPMDLFDGSAIEGKQVTVRRDATLGRMVPMNFGVSGSTVPIGPVLLQDKQGNDVRLGDEVSIRKTSRAYDRSFVAIVKGFDKRTGTLTIVQKGQKVEKKLKRIKSFVRFERRATPVDDIPRKPLGNDRMSFPVSVGDIVRLYDEYDDGRVVGKLIDYSQDGNYAVLRPDGKQGSAPGNAWLVAAASIERVPTIRLGTDRNGVPLIGGDRVQLRKSGATAYVVSQADANNYAVIRDDRGDTGPNGYALAAIENVAKISDEYARV